MKNKISIAISLILILALFGWLVNVSLKKIQSKTGEEADVISHYSIYQEQGYPVYTKELQESKVAYFITDITLNGTNNNNNIYKALVSQDKVSLIEIGNKVYVPKNEDALRTGFSWEDTSKYIVGTVTSLSRVADWQTGFYQVNIQLEKELPKNPFYSAKVVSTIKENIVVVPIANLDSINGEYYAWLYDDKMQAVQNLINTGTCDGYNCEVISGVNAGDRIITSDRKLLTKGMLLNNRGERK